MTPDQEKRCEAVLVETFHGIHHVDNINKAGGFYWTITASPMATWDFDYLTRLVLAAHRHAVRVEVGPGGPRRVKLVLHPREREGSMSHRHPTIADAIWCYERQYPAETIQPQTQPKEPNATV